MLNYHLIMDTASDSQRIAFEKCTSADSEAVMCTGPGGTGKTWLIQRIVEHYTENPRAGPISVTAATGTAACLIGGSTLHSFAGVGFEHKDLNRMLEALSSKFKVQNNWKKIKVLVIDEVSMVPAIFMDNLNAIAKAIRDNNKPFGGIKVLMFGDFLQLPPVDKSKPPTEKFAFESRYWSEAKPSVVVLKEQMRVEDRAYAKALDHIRAGDCPDWVAKLMAEDKNSLDTSEGCVRIFPHKNTTDQHNQSMQARLEGDEVLYNATGHTRGEWPAPTKLNLKVGSQVMFVANIPWWGVCNGTVGKVKEFVKEIGGEDLMVPVVEFTDVDGFEATRKVHRWTWELRSASSMLEFRQVPLMLSWAITIHKSQGKTISKLAVDLKGTFAPGQLYVALSRVRTRGDVSISGFKEEYAFAHPSALEFYRGAAHECEQDHEVGELVDDFQLIL